jgi:4-hydroxy 2-oxovalerate aldolase
MTAPAEAITAPRYRLTDSTLRDGSHALAHQYTAEQVAAIAGALDRAGVPVIEISHGDGLGGSSFNYGFSKRDERDLIRAAAAVVKRSKLAVLLLPGIGLARDLGRSARSASRSPGLRRTAPRRTSRSSTCGRRRTSAWRPSAS